MPKLDPKQVRADLERGILWPFYWVYGPETWRVRQVVEQIRAAVRGGQERGGEGAFGGEKARGLGAFGFSDTVLDGAEVSASEIVDAARTISFGGGTRWVLVKEAHTLSDPEDLSVLFGKSGKREEMEAVCVFVARNLDARKKFSKLLLEKAAVVACEEIAEFERERWILALAKKRCLTLSEAVLLRLCGLDPWSLDLMEREFEKLELGADDEVQSGGNGAGDLAVGLQSGVSREGGHANTVLSREKGGEAFLDAFLSRNLKRAAPILDTFADSPEEALPLLGLLAWNVRHLALLKAAKRDRSSNALRLSPFVIEKLDRYSRYWNLEELVRLQESLEELDFGTKQTFRSALGLWGNLTHTFCR